jgi:hypothetical protein
MTDRRKSKLIALAPMFMVASVSETRAENLDYGVDVGVGETDNVTLVSNNKISQTLTIADLDFALQEQRRLFDITAKGDFSDLYFLQGAYGNELIGRFDGVAHLALVPERIAWVLQDDFGQAQLDPFAAMTPTNRENINYASTGPDATFRLGGTGFVNLSARYARTQYETSPFDNNQYEGTIALGRLLSARSSVSLDGTIERVLFDDTAINPETNTATNTDFNRTSLYGHYELQGARTEIMANLGVTQVDQKGQSFSGPSSKLQLSRVLSTAAKLTFAAGRDITDASAGFSNVQPGAIGGIGTAPATVSSMNYTITYASAQWQYTRNRTTMALSGRWEKDAYDGQPLSDLARGTAEFRVDRQLTPVLSLQIRGSIYRTDYANVDYSETDALIGGSLIFRKGRGTEIRLRCDHTSRDVTGIGSGYTENRIFLTLGYKPKSQATTFRGPDRSITPHQAPDVDNESNGPGRL